MNDIELIDEIVKRAEEHQKQREKEFAIEELEKIKEEIENIRDVEVTDGIIYANEFDVFDIIDKRIAELKGVL